MEFLAVIFDLDGLLIDTESINRDAWLQAMSDLGYEVTEKEYLNLIGLNFRDTKKETKKNLGMDFPFGEAYALEQKYIAEFITEHGISRKQGALEILACIDELSLAKAVASSSNRDTVIKRLKLTDLWERFDHIVGGDEVQNGKPAPDIFLTAARLLQTEPKHCLVLEDSEPGVEAAHAAGMRTIMIPDLKPPSEKTRRLTEKILPSLYEAKRYIEKRVSDP